jgi:hypothetical protein
MIGVQGNCLSTNNDGYSMVDDDVIGNVVGKCGSTRWTTASTRPGSAARSATTSPIGNAGFGIHCWHNCNRQVITNNLVFDNHEGGILIGQGTGPTTATWTPTTWSSPTTSSSTTAPRGSGRTARRPGNAYLNNIVNDNAEGRHRPAERSESGTSHLRSVFVNFQLNGSGDYRLQPWSAGVDGGTSDGAPADRHRRHSRPQGEGVDIGVFEQ